MNITVTLNNSNIEWVTSNIIKKMYQLAMDPNNTVSYSGYLKSPSGYASQVEYLNNTFGPGLRVEAAKEYLEFEDDAAEALCAKYFGDGIGCTIANLQGANDWRNVSVDGVKFADALPTSGIKKFNEFQYLPTQSLGWLLFGRGHTIEEITLPNTPITIGGMAFTNETDNHDVIVHNATSIIHMDQYGSNSIADGYILDFNKYNGRFENNGYGRSEVANCGNEYIILAKNSVLNRTSSDDFEMNTMYHTKTVVFREDFVANKVSICGTGPNGYGIPETSSITSAVFLSVSVPYSSISLDYGPNNVYVPSQSISAYLATFDLFRTAYSLETFANISDANKDILVEAGCTATGSTGNWTIKAPGEA